MIDYLYSQKDNNVKVGFMFEHPRSLNQVSLDYQTEIQLNKLISRLNRKYYTLFPHTQHAYYKIIYADLQNRKQTKLIDIKSLSEDDNLTRIKHEINGLKMIICFGEKSNYVLNKIKNKFDLDIDIIKTKNLSYSYSRHIKLLNQTNQKRIRTNFEILSHYKWIDHVINNLNKSSK